MFELVTLTLIACILFIILWCYITLIIFFERRKYAAIPGPEPDG